MEKRSVRILSALSSSPLGKPANLYKHFVEHVPAIELAIENGHTREAIVAWLGTQGVTLNLKRYDTYLWRYRSRRREADAKLASRGNSREAPEGTSAGRNTETGKTAEENKPSPPSYEKEHLEGIVERNKAAAGSEQRRVVFDSTPRVRRS